MSEEEISSSSADEQTKSALSPSPPETVDKNESSDSKGSDRIASEKNGGKGNSKNNTGKKKRKRRQRSKSEDERELIELQKERYDRLIYTARKHLHKTAKQIKTFLLQKEIRKRSGKNEENDSTGLDAKKSLDLDVVTSQAIRQLGLYHCDPRFKIAPEETIPEDAPTETGESNLQEKNLDTEKNDTKRKKRSKNDSRKDDNTPPVIPPPLALDDPKKPLVDAVLAHKRFSKSLEEWNEKVTEYRRWCMKLEQRNNPNPFGMDDDFGPSKRSKKNKNKQKNGRSATSIADAGLQATVENESSLFCTLGGGVPNVGIEKDEFNKYSQYGPGAEFGEAPKRKNRKGQRQRRAKALAIEAKKQGRSHEYYQSANWREPKANKENDEDQGKRKSRGRGREPNRNQRSIQQQQNQDYDYSFSHQPKQQQQQQQQYDKNQTDEKQHPSWAAKQAQSTGIVAFKGTKITF